MQNIRDDLLAKSVKDRLEQLEKEGVIRPEIDPKAGHNITRSDIKYPFRSSFIALILSIIFVSVVGYFTDNLKVTEYLQGSVIVVVATTLVFFIISLLYRKFKN